MDPQHLCWGDVSQEMHVLTDLPDEDLGLGIRVLVRKYEGGEHISVTSTSLAN